jgi:hypothetical protein
MPRASWRGFLATFSGILSSLFVPSDDPHETCPLAPGVAAGHGSMRTKSSCRIGVEGGSVPRNWLRSPLVPIPALMETWAPPLPALRSGHLEGFFTVSNARAHAREAAALSI